MANSYQREPRPAEEEELRRRLRPLVRLLISLAGVEPESEEAEPEPAHLTSPSQASE